MKTIYLEKKLNELYPNHRFIDKHDLISLQFTSDDMIEFAKQMSHMAVDLCAYNLKSGKNCELINGKLVVNSDITKVLNTKNQIK